MSATQILLLAPTTLQGNNIIYVLYIQEDVCWDAASAIDDKGLTMAESSKSFAKPRGSLKRVDRVPQVGWNCHYCWYCLIFSLFAFVHVPTMGQGARVARYILDHMPFFLMFPVWRKKVGKGNLQVYRGFAPPQGKEPNETLLAQ